MDPGGELRQLEKLSVESLQLFSKIVYAFAYAGYHVTFREMRLLFRALLEVGESSKGVGLSLSQAGEYGKSNKARGDCE